MKRNEE